MSRKCHGKKQIDSDESSTNAEEKGNKAGREGYAKKKKRAVIDTFLLRRILNPIRKKNLCFYADIWDLAL